MFQSTFVCAYILYSLLLPELGVVLANPNPQRLQHFIVGGTRTTIKTDPYMVQIWVGEVFACAGSLLNEMFVLTAAHCFNNVAQDQITVIGNASKLNDEGIKRKVQLLMIPRGYNSGTQHLDVATVKLDAAMTGVPSIPLYTGDLTNGMSIRVSGWGRTTENGQLSTDLRTTTVNVIDRQTCASLYRMENLAVTNSMFCASSLGKDSCNGDSGGPAVYEGKICGIVSWGLGCARNNYPGAYTSIPFVKAFIESTLKQ